MLSPRARVGPGEAPGLARGPHYTSALSGLGLTLRFGVATTVLAATGASTRPSRICSSVLRIRSHPSATIATPANTPAAMTVNAPPLSAKIHKTASAQIQSQDTDRTKEHAHKHFSTRNAVREMPQRFARFRFGIVRVKRAWKNRVTGDGSDTSDVSDAGEPSFLRHRFHHFPPFITCITHLLCASRSTVKSTS